MILRNRHPKRSTTIYNVISSLLTPEQQLLSPYEKLKEGRKYIFNFSYPAPENVKKSDFNEFFELLFLSRYATNYFAYETFEKWQLKLISRINSIMTGYVILLEEVIYTEQDNRFLNYSHTKTVNTGDSTNNTSNDNRSIGSEFPQNIIQNFAIGDVKYANSGTVDKGTTTSKSTNDSVVNSTTYNGNSFDIVVANSDKIIHIFDNLLNEFEFLFNPIM